MLKEAVTVHLTEGMEPQLAMKFVDIACQYGRCDIRVEMDDKIVNAKSIMGMMALGIVNGETVTLHVNGSDENEAMQGLIRFLTEREA